MSESDSINLSPGVWNNPNFNIVNVESGISLPNNPASTSKTLFDYYEYYDHNTTWEGSLINATVFITALRITRVGNVVQIRLPQFTATGNLKKVSFPMIPRGKRTTNEPCAYFMMRFTFSAIS